MEADLDPAGAPVLHTLANGVRVVVLPRPHLGSASVSVFVRSGSAHESRAHNGISHVIEHMVFKGTRDRDARRINLEAERLGTEVDAHTDKDHTAFHMHGMAAHAPQFVRMLGDIVGRPTFPAEELERERQVLLQEFVEDEDDPMSTAYKLFDGACWGLHPVAQPVIGRRSSIERLGRDDLAGHVARRYTGPNVVVAAAGGVDAQAVLDEAARVFGELPAGESNRVPAPAYAGGVRARRLSGSSQAHLVMGFPIVSRAQDDALPTLAAALLGEGMSSPLLERLREQQGLVYHASASADVLEMCGQLVVEASTSPQHLETVIAEVTRLFAELSARVDADELERARNQVAVRWLRWQERPYRELEEAALDLFARGRMRGMAERLEALRAVDAAQLREGFARMLALGPSLAVAGSLGRFTSRRGSELLAGR